MLRRIALLVPLLAVTLLNTSLPAQNPPAPAPTPAPAPAPQDPPIPADTQLVTTASGLKYSVLAPGKNDVHPKLGDHVTMHYTVWLTDGMVVDSSRKRGQPLEFDLGKPGIIKGWEEATLLMTEGARLKLTVPPELAWGDAGRAPIPGKATVIFEVELVGFVSMPEFHPAVKDAQKTTPSGISYQMLREGTGESPKNGEVVNLRFAQWNAEGTLLACTEQRGNRPFAVLLDQLHEPILNEGTRLLKVGGRIRLEATAKVAYGENLQPGTPADVITVWEVELVAIKKPLPVPPFALTEESKLQKTASGLGYEVLHEGTGKTPKLGKEVTVHFAGWLTDGTLVESSYQRAEPLTFPLGRHMQGWNEGFQLMKEGAIYKFTIPGNLAYGKPGNANLKIPADATIVYYVELISCVE